jgi:hypothetical protein
LTASGKVQKFLLREQVIKALGLEETANRRTAQAALGMVRDREDVSSLFLSLWGDQIEMGFLYAHDQSGYNNGWFSALPSFNCAQQWA